MSVATVTAIGSIAEGLTETLTETATAILNSVTVVAWPIAAVVGAVEVGKLFSKIWNKNRSKLPELNLKLEAAQKQIVDLGANTIQPTLKTANAFLVDQESVHQMDKINTVFNLDIKTQIQELVTKYEAFNQSLSDQYLEYIKTLGVFYVAGGDNAFYTENKGEIDRLIDAYTTATADIDQLVEVGTATAQAINELISSVPDAFNRSMFVVSVTLAPPTYIPLPNEAQTLRDRLDGVRNDPVTVESLTTYIPTLDQLAEYLMSRSATLTKTITREITKRRKLKRRRKRKLKKKKQKKKTPQMVKTMWIDTMNSSKWIKRVEFTFPSKQDIFSDNRGTLKFYLKKGGVIRKVRVKRGTFSTIAVWSVGTKLGVGYRYWSQFNKAAIVNKKVFSYSLARITAQDREIAIPIEIIEKRVKYR